MQISEFAAGGSSSLIIIVYVALFAAFYFFLIRPQSKRQKDKKNMVESVKKGDKIITTGGLYGVVTAVKDDTFTLRVAPRVEVMVSRSALASIEGKISKDDLKQSQQEMKKVSQSQEDGAPAAIESEEADEAKKD